MAVQPLTSPKFRALDANANPLSGGLLYSYEAGTTTPLATYTTRAGDVANANPVVLDANGEADVWCTPNVLYKFVLKSSAGVTQWTVDNVPSFPDYSQGLFDVGDGTVSSPAIRFINDPNTGLYRIASDTIGLATNGTEAQRWSTAGTSIAGTISATGAATIGGNVALTGSNPASTTGFTDTITPTNIIKAWGLVKTDGAGGISVLDGFNVASASITGSSTIAVTFTTAMANANYAMVATGAQVLGAGSQAKISELGARSSSAFTVQMYDWNATSSIAVASTVVSFSFIVLGAQ